MHLQRLSSFSSAALLLAFTASGALAQSIHSAPGGGAGPATGSTPIGQVRTDTRPLLAVLPFEGKKIDADQVAILADALASDLMRSGKVRVMERAQMDRILKEQGFQNSGLCDGGECAVEMGRLLGIDQMVVGSVGQLGRTYIITARLVSVSTGEVIRSASRSQQGEIDRMLTELVPRVAQDLVGESAAVKSVDAAPVVKPRASKPAPQKDEQPADPGFRRFRWGVDGSILTTGVALGDSFRLAGPGESIESQAGGGYSVNIVADWFFNPTFGLRSSVGFASRGWELTSTYSMEDPFTGLEVEVLDLTADYRVSYLDLTLGLQARLGRRFALAGGYMLSRPLSGEASLEGFVGDSSISNEFEVKAPTGDVSIEDAKSNEYLFASHSLFLEAEFLFNEHVSLLLGSRLSASSVNAHVETNKWTGNASIERLDEEEGFAISDLSLGLRYRF